jgi:hypothetical protein
MKKRTICFLISDFRDTGFDAMLKRAGGRHDLVALRVEDPLEREFPAVGWLQVEDPETGISRWVNTNRKRVRRRHAQREAEREAALKSTFLRSGVDEAVLMTDKPYVQPLMQLFDRRG